MVNYFAIKKITEEIKALESEKKKNYYFIFAKSEDDEAIKIKMIQEQNNLEEIVFIIVREDRWLKK